MTLSSRNRIGYLFVVISLLSIIALLPIQTYDFYLLLRWVLSLGFIWAFILSVNENRNVVFSSIVCIAGVWVFRPISILEADRDFWFIPDLLAGLYFGFIAFSNLRPAKTYETYLYDEKINELNEASRSHREKWRANVSEQTLEEYRKGQYRFDLKYFDEDEIRYNKLMESLNLLGGALLIGLIVLGLYLFSSRNS